MDNKDDQKEWLLKRLKNIKDKNEKLQNTLSKAIKAGKNVNYFYYNSMYNFRKFYRDFGKFLKMASLYSKRDELIDFLKLFIDFKGFELPSDNTKKLKNKAINKTHQLYSKYFNTYKKEYHSEDLNKEDKNFFDLNQCKIFGKKKQKLEPTEEKIKGETQKPLWSEIDKPEFEELKDDIYNNQDNKDFKITINKRTYDLENVKKFWREVTASRISKNEAKG